MELQLQVPLLMDKQSYYLVITLALSGISLALWKKSRDRLDSAKKPFRSCIDARTNLRPSRRFQTTSFCKYLSYIFLTSTLLMNYCSRNTHPINGFRLLKSVHIGGPRPSRTPQFGLGSKQQTVSSGSRSCFLDLRVLL